MENNKKAQSLTKAGNAKGSHTINDCNRQKSSTELQLVNKYWSKNSRRRENPLSARSSNNNSISQYNNKNINNENKTDKDNVNNSNNSNNNNDKQILSTNLSYTNVENTSLGITTSSTDNDDHKLSNVVTGTRLKTTISNLSSDRRKSGVVPRRTYFDHSVNDPELNSVYLPGSKKQSLNHLLNFYYKPHDKDCMDAVSIGHPSRHFNNRKHKYNKEQFLQANFQFVIKSVGKHKTNISPDTLIDWSLIEQINIQTTEEAQCPICLYPPIAAKITRCGHVYCWPCILHYLSLSDKTWRKCPICYEAIHGGDLKTAAVIKQQSFDVGTMITFQLMCRRKGSLSIEKFIVKNLDTRGSYASKYSYVSDSTDQKVFAKFLLAKRSDVLDILKREEVELLKAVDISCPEHVFVQQALELLKERRRFVEGAVKKYDHDFIINNNNDNDESGKDKRHRGKKTCNLHDKIMLISKPTLELNLDHVSKKLTFSTDNNTEVTTPSSVGSTESLELMTSASYLSLADTDNNAIVTSEGNVNTGTCSKLYYFYQCEDGQHIYLHPLNVKMLQACYDGLANAPPVIKARVLQKEEHSMNEDYRRKYTCLSHLPITCQFEIVEIELLPPYVTHYILDLFQADIAFRKKMRRRRERKENERDKRINAINERQMGKLVTSKVHLDLNSSYEFPTCGLEETHFRNNMERISRESDDNLRQEMLNTNSYSGSTYSAVALRCQQEDRHLSILDVGTNTERHLFDNNEDNEVEYRLNCHIYQKTNLGDVLAEALSQHEKVNVIKYNTQTNNANDKEKNRNKKTNVTKSKKDGRKKMQPLYSTSMKFGGN